MSNDLLYLLIISNIVFFILGYILANVSNKNYNNTIESGYIFHRPNKKEIEQTKVIKKLQSVDIDESKVVLETDISGLEKKFGEITETKTVNDNISDSINKLSQIMKGK